jgi:hypothetical protein
MGSKSETGIFHPHTPQEFLARVKKGDFENMSEKEISAIIPDGISKYAIIDAKRHMHQIALAFGQGWNIFNPNFRMLEVACGGIGTDGQPPWAAAIMGQLANVTGVDYAAPFPILSDCYYHVQCDLTQLGEEGLLGVDGIYPGYDVVTFFNTLTDRTISPFLRDSVRESHVSYDQVQHNIEHNMRSLLKPGGIYYTDSHNPSGQIFRYA